jgi:hypothetical protein
MTYRLKDILYSKFDYEFDDFILPKKIYVSGMPFDLHGWNGTYIYEEDKFVLKSYMLYGCIEIIGTSIYLKDGRWCIQRKCDTNPFLYNDYLEGNWKYFKVSRTESHFKKKLFIILSMMTLIFLILMFV